MAKRLAPKRGDRAIITAMIADEVYEIIDSCRTAIFDDYGEDLVLAVQSKDT